MLAIIILDDFYSLLIMENSHLLKIRSRKYNEKGLGIKHLLIWDRIDKIVVSLSYYHINSHTKLQQTRFKKRQLNSLFLKKNVLKY